MAISNGPVRVKRRAAPRRDPADRPASKRRRRPVGEVTNNRQALAGVTDAVPKKRKQLRENPSGFPLKPVLIGATAIVMAAGVGLLLGRWWMRR